MEKKQRAKTIKQKKVIYSYLKELNKKDKITLLTNPEQFIKFNLEKINPNHKGIIWGLRKRKYRKIKGNNWVQVAKIQFSEMITIISYSINDKIMSCINFIVYHAEQSGVFVVTFYLMFSVIFYMLCFEIGGLKNG